MPHNSPYQAHTYLEVPVLKYTHEGYRPAVLHSPLDPYTSAPPQSDPYRCGISNMSMSNMSMCNMSMSNMSTSNMRMYLVLAMIK